MSADQELPDIVVNDDCNYIAAFLTMACPYSCSYCINNFEAGAPKYPTISGSDWVRALSRLKNLERDTGPIPVTLQGGEPSVHRDFYQIINETPQRIRLDVLTNLSFDIEEMIRKVDPARLKRDAPYASIRVSYHPSEVDVKELFARTHRMMDAGFSIGLFGVLHPSQADHILDVQQQALAQGIDFRTKEFLGFEDGKLYGQYKYQDACTMQSRRKVRCRTTELLIAPDGSTHRCHQSLYTQHEPLGSILEPDFQMLDCYNVCDDYGFCNPCDIKVKTNRLQQFGHTSVDILFDDESQANTSSATKKTSAKVS